MFSYIESNSLSTSDFIDNNTQNAFGVSVGVIASISSVMQAIAGACQFSAKKEGHRAAAEEYNNLMVKILKWHNFLINQIGCVYKDL